MNHHTFLMNYKFAISYLPLSNDDLMAFLKYINHLLDLKKIEYKKSINATTKEDNDLYCYFQNCTYHNLDTICYIFKNENFKISCHYQMLYIDFNKNIDFNLGWYFIKKIYKYILEHHNISPCYIYVDNNNSSFFKDNKTMSSYLIDCPNFENNEISIVNHKDISPYLEYTLSKNFQLASLENKNYIYFLYRDEIFMRVDSCLQSYTKTKNQIQYQLKRLNKIEEHYKESFKNIFKNVKNEDILEYHWLKFIGGK